MKEHIHKDKKPTDRFVHQNCLHINTSVKFEMHSLGVIAEMIILESYLALSVNIS